jgi:hypothetical protein
VSLPAKHKWKLQKQFFACISLSLLQTEMASIVKEAYCIKPLVGKDQFKNKISSMSKFYLSF